MSYEKNSQARRYQIEGILKVGRPCLVWEDTLRKEANKVGTMHMLNSVEAEDCDMKEIERIILEEQISEDEDDSWFNSSNMLVVMIEAMIMVNDSFVNYLS